MTDEQPSISPNSSPPVKQGKKARQSKFPVIFSLLSATALTLWIVRNYVGLEAPYYWSDFNYYEWACRISLNAMIDSPITYPLLLVSSATLSHNLFFTAPLAPLMAVLGDNRTGFIESVSLAYFIPFVALLADLGRKLFQPRVTANKWLYLIFTVLCLAIPPLWAPLLRGYPDYSAAMAILWCVHLYFSNRDLAQEKSNYALGFFLALAVLLRRYCAYEAIAFVLVLLIDQYLRLKSLNGLKAKFMPFMQIALAGTVTTCALGFAFLVNVTRHNYHALYESYHVSLLHALSYFGSSYGLILLLASVSGTLLACKAKLWQWENFRFVAMLYGISCLFWLLGPNELGTHYTLYFTPLVAMGLFALAVMLTTASEATNSGSSFDADAKSSALKFTAAAVLAAFLGLNFLLSLNPAKFGRAIGIKQFAPGMLSFVESEAEPVGYLFSANYGPWQRSDRSALHNLVTDFRAAIASEDPNLRGRMHQAKLSEKRGLVYVAAFSNILNAEALRNAERELYGKYGDTISWSELPCVDSKDEYALERLLGASYVVVSDKGQYFIAEKEQDILTAVLLCFKEKWPLAQDFVVSKKIKPEVLDGGLVATVYERVRPTALKEAALTLAKMRDFIKERPGSQPSWITTGTLSEICYDLKRQNFEFKLAVPREKCLEGERRYLLYSDKLPDAFVLQGEIVKKGIPVPLAVECVQLDQEGNQIVSQQIVLKDERTPLKLTLERGRTAFLALVLDRSADGENGSVIFEKLKVKAVARENLNR